MDFCRLRQRPDGPAQPHFPAGTFRRACPANAVLPLAAQAGRLRRIPHTGRKITIFLTRIQIILAFRLPVVFTSPRSPCKPKSRVRLAVQDSRLSRGQHGFESRTRCHFLYSFRHHEQFMMPFLCLCVAINKKPMVETMGFLFYIIFCVTGNNDGIMNSFEKIIPFAFLSLVQ